MSPVVAASQAMVSPEDLYILDVTQFSKALKEIQMPVRFIVSEYNLLWEALRHYRQHLEHVSASSSDEDEQLLVDENLVKLDGMFTDVQMAAKQDWDLNLK